MANESGLWMPWMPMDADGCLWMPMDADGSEPKHPRSVPLPAPVQFFRSHAPQVVPDELTMRATKGTCYEIGIRNSQI